MENKEEAIYDFLYNVMCGKEKEVIVTKEKDELGMPITAEVAVPISVRMKAAELLLKSNTDNKNTGLSVPVVIYDDM